MSEEKEESTILASNANAITNQENTNTNSESTFSPTTEEEKKDDKIMSIDAEAPAPVEEKKDDNTVKPTASAEEEKQVTKPQENGAATAAEAEKSEPVAEEEIKGEATTTSDEKPTDNEAAKASRSTTEETVMTADDTTDGSKEEDTPASSPDNPNTEAKPENTTTADDEQPGDAVSLLMGAITHKEEPRKAPKEITPEDVKKGEQEASNSAPADNNIDPKGETQAEAKPAVEEKPADAVSWLMGAFTKPKTEETSNAEEDPDSADAKTEEDSLALVPLDTPEAPVGLQHSFEAGDHVIRWEMLPIVWPIQVHGIVLEVNEFCVTICDFGLTAEMRKDDATTKQEVEETLNEDNKKGNKTLLEAWDKVKPKDNTQKNRITVHIITTQEEIKPWKKVHYGRGLFGLGGGDDANNAEGEDGDPSRSPKKGGIVKQKFGAWFKRVGQRAGERKEKVYKNIQERREHRQKLKQEQQQNQTAAAAVKEETENIEGEHEHQPTCLKGNFAAYHHHDWEETEGEDKTLTQSTSDPSLNTSSQDNSQNSSAKENTAMVVKEKKEEKNKLPESDPPKLVLARTRLLLEQGEAILPPYHPFKSNSECIAVFCKTGYWRTLQASVFLHSTAIGNAKSSMAVTLGVAASMPLLAPAIALAGAAAVGAPYIILNQSHKMWQETTLRLTQEFWAQAPNDVFVECIEHWSNLDNDEADNIEEEEKQAEAVTEDKKEDQDEAEEAAPAPPKKKQSREIYVSV